MQIEEPSEKINDEVVEPVEPNENIEEVVIQPELPSENVDAQIEESIEKNEEAVA